MADSENGIDNLSELVDNAMSGAQLVAVLHEYISDIGYDAVKDYQAVAKHMATANIIESLPSNDDFMAIIHGLGGELDKLSEFITSQLRGALNIKRKDSAVTRINSLRDNLGKYNSILRAMIGSAGYYAELTSQPKTWVSVEYLLEYEELKHKFLKQWREVRTELMQTAELNACTSMSIRTNVTDDGSVNATIDGQIQADTPVGINGAAGPTRCSTIDVEVTNTAFGEGQSGSPLLFSGETPIMVSTPFRPRHSAPNVTSRNHREPNSFGGQFLADPRPVNRNALDGFGVTPDNVNTELTRNELTSLLRQLSVGNSHRNHPESNHFKNLHVNHPKFGGEITEFRDWYSSYKEFIGNSDKSNYLKLLSLKELLIGEAQDKIFGPGSQLRGDYYPIAIQRLIKEYDCIERLQRGYYDRLGRIVVPDIGNLKDLRAVYEEILMLTTAMKCDDFDMGLRQRIERKFPKQLVLEVIRKQYAVYRGNLIPLSVFLEAIDNEIAALENVERVTTPSRNMSCAMKQDRHDRKTKVQFGSGYAHVALGNNLDWSSDSDSSPEAECSEDSETHVCKLCDDTNKRHYEHKCPKFSDYKLRVQKIMSDNRCVQCFELAHRDGEICRRATAVCPIDKCSEIHGLAICEKFDDYVHENKGNFSFVIRK